MESIAVQVKIGDELFSEYGFQVKEGELLPVEGMVISRGMNLYIVDSAVQTKGQYHITLLPAIRGFIFNIKDHKWSSKLNIDITFKSMLDYDGGGGDEFSISEFIDIAEGGGINDYDGFSDELVLNGKVIATDVDLIDVMFRRDEFLEFEKEHPGATIVWYNK